MQDSNSYNNDINGDEDNEINSNPLKFNDKFQQKLDEFKPS